MSPATETLDWLGGFVAAEGCLLHSGNAFAMRVALGARDQQTCLALQQALGVGNVHTYPRRLPHYDDVVVYSVGSVPDLVHVVVPFLDDHLPPSHKRLQYIDWRRSLLVYWENTFRRKRQCVSIGCEQLARAKGLCRRHYYQAFGR